MNVVELRTADNRVVLERSYDKSSDSEADQNNEQKLKSLDFGLLIVGCALCSDARLDISADGLQAIGDPTEAALVMASARFGIRKEEVEKVLPRVAEVPFESERKRMTTVHQVQSADGLEAFGIGECLTSASSVSFTKGAVDSLVEICTHVLVGDETRTMDSVVQNWVSAANAEMAGCGMRVIALAFRTHESSASAKEPTALEQNLVFVGLIGMLDPPRKEARSAVDRCGTAGIRTLMITGDHPLTARHVANEVGIASEGGVVTGHQLSAATAQQLDLIVKETSVFARVSPEHKLSIVEALQRRGAIVAMTGDGVNDAPALKKANIGVAMGMTGTDVAKQAADMVLLDDNFATIVAAVEEGRVIYDNVRKFIRYILATNSGELWLMLLAPALGMPLPLVPLQILWMNLVTDGLPAVALALEPPERYTMKRPPYSPAETILGRGLGWHVIWVGLLMGVLAVVTGYVGWRNGFAGWQTMVFTTITFAQMAHVMAIRSERDSTFKIGVFSNRALIGAVGLTVVLQTVLIYLPVLQATFHTHPLSPIALLICVAIASVVFGLVEVEKMIRRRTPDKVVMGSTNGNQYANSYPAMGESTQARVR